jgi:hypothetical protein
MASAECAIWKTPAELLEKAGDFEVFDSPRAGGKYWISGTGIGQIISFNDRAKRLLTTWLCQQRHSGVEVPKINADIVELIKGRRDLLVTERMNAALIFLASNLTEISGSLSLGGLSEMTMRFFAETESRNLGDLSQLYTMLKDLGLVAGAFSVGGSVSVRPTAGGHGDAGEIRRSRIPIAFTKHWNVCAVGTVARLLSKVSGTIVSRTEGGVPILVADESRSQNGVFVSYAAYLQAKIEEMPSRLAISLAE